MMRDVIELESHPLLGEPFAAETDRFTSTAIRQHNAVTLMPSGSQSYAKRWELIDKARHSLDLVSFSVMRDRTSYRLRDALLEKMRQGVAVRMVVDDAVLYTTFSSGILDELAKAGAEILRYHRIARDWLPDHRGHPFRQLARNAKYKMKRRFHEKYMIVDGSEVILGGINWGNKYAFGGLQPKAWRDTDVHLTGPVVADVQRKFIESFFLYRAMDEEHDARRQPGFDRTAHYEKSRRDAEAFIQENAQVYFPDLPREAADNHIRYVPHKPYDEERLPLTEAYLAMFRKAQKYIYWGCHGIRPPRIIAETLAEAVERGVEIRLITNSRQSSRTLMAAGVLGLMYWESSNHFRWLLEHGIKVFEWQKPGAFHSKNLAIDDVVAAVGSYNIANGSTFHHTESNVIVYGGSFPLQVRQQFEIDLQDCRELPLAEAKKTPPQYDPFLRPLHQRNLLIDRSLLTDAVRRDLDAGRFKSQ